MIHWVFQICRSKIIITVIICPLTNGLIRSANIGWHPIQATYCMFFYLKQNRRIQKIKTEWTLCDKLFACNGSTHMDFAPQVLKQIRFLGQLQTFHHVALHPLFPALLASQSKCFFNGSNVGLYILIAIHVTYSCEFNPKLLSLGLVMIGTDMWNILHIRRSKRSFVNMEGVDLIERMWYIQYCGAVGLSRLARFCYLVSMCAVKWQPCRRLWQMILHAVENEKRQESEVGNMSLPEEEAWSNWEQVVRIHPANLLKLEYGSRESCWQLQSCYFKKGSCVSLLPQNTFFFAMMARLKSVNTLHML